MKAQSIFKTLVIAASASIPVAVTGSSFYLEFATGAVHLMLDDGATLSCKSGQTIELPAGDTFEKILFTNPDTTNSITITYYAGTLSVGTRTPAVYTKPAPSYLIAKTYTTILTTDILIATTNLRAGKTIPDSRQYVILQWAGADGDIIGVSHTTGGGANVGYYLSNLYATTVRLDTPGTISLYQTTVPASAVVALQFFNYDS